MVTYRGSGANTGKTPIIGFAAVGKKPKADASRVMSNLNSSMLTINKRDATLLQELIAHEIQQRIKRQAVSTGRLVTVTKDARNRSYDHTGFAVGIPKFLNTSLAKYWRTIEEGSAKTWRKRPFVGLELPGVFGAGMGGTGPYSNPGKGGRGGKFRGFMTEEQYLGMKGEYRGPVMRVKRNIQPMNAYRDTFRKFSSNGRFARTYAKQIQATLRAS